MNYLQISAQKKEFYKYYNININTILIFYKNYTKKYKNQTRWLLLASCHNAKQHRHGNMHRGTSQALHSQIAKFTDEFWDTVSLALVA